ncbi:MAG: DUF2171 domain-containing protein [Chloroflexi bacterium]|nr:DUF2171 domain-containing protein [Chloroflexota bacterium]
MASSYRKLSLGMNVMGADGNMVGQIKELRENDFLAHRPGKPEIYIPFNAISNIADFTVTLNIAAGQADQMGWEQPPQAGSAAA